MNKLTGLIMIALGAGLAWHGWRLSQGLSSQLSEMVSGGASNEVIMYMAGGVALIVIGLLALKGRGR